jgi:hypothetical protein
VAATEHKVVPCLAPQDHSQDTAALPSSALEVGMDLHCGDLTGHLRGMEKGLLFREADQPQQTPRYPQESILEVHYAHL